MALRFRRTFSLFPGVRLNLSGSGVSATVGVPGASINFGPRGTTLNLGLPGTGLSYRQRLSRPDRSGPIPVPSQPERPQDPSTSRSTPPPEGEIRSANVAQLTSPDLRGLKQLINEAASRKRALAAQLESDIASRNAAWRSLERNRKMPLRPFTGRRVPELQAVFEARSETLEERAEEYDACHVQVDFALGKGALDAYAALAEAHARLSRSRKVWDVTSSIAIDGVALRTTATASITRSPTSLAVAGSGMVASRWAGLILGNTNGEDAEIFPGFCLMRDRRNATSDFALIDLRDLRLEATSTRFIETESVPPDAKIIGHTWEKANKDGTRDRRFANNRQIPVALYGEVILRSSSGVHDAWMFSDHDAAHEFAAAYARLQRALHDLTREGSPETKDAPFPVTEPARYTIPPLPEVHGAYEYSLSAIAAVGIALWLGWPRVNTSHQTDSIPSIVVPLAPSLERPTSSAPSAPMSPPATASTPVPTLQPSVAQAPQLPAQSVTTAPANETVVTRQGANVRADANGSAPIVRTVRRGVALQVHGRRGGWIQVGDTAPWGWIHGSLLDEGR